MKNNNKTRKALMDAGYYVGNIWHIDDVKDKFKDVSDDDAQDVLDEVLTSHWIIEKIQERIYDIGKERGYNERD
ncbi:MAG TPA: hypothetical protein DCW83_09395 [Saprospirales bacterium]|nr:hypothetical protein [Saprospirales bacterium]